ncbi:helix-turn-helix transcriptional regulator [Oerskovia turbata]
MLETSARLLALLSLLQARRDWPGEALAERLRVSPRTVRRDVDRLRELGYPVRATKGPDGGYRLDAGADLPPLLFDDEQAVAVAVALQTSSVGGLEEPAQRALATIRQVMPARLRGRIDALEVTAVRSSAQAARPDVDPAVLVAVGSAVRAREVLRFDYDGGTSPVVGAGDAAFRPPRRVEPHHLVTWGGRWYLVAFDLERADWRTFRVDRMTPRTPTGPRFAPRDLPDAPDVAAYVARQFSRPRWPAEGEVVLHARAEDLAPWVGDHGVIEAIGPDRARLVAGSWSWGGLAAWVGMFDVPFDVVGPPELRAAVAETGRRYREAAER